MQTGGRIMNRRHRMSPILVLLLSASQVFAELGGKSESTPSPADTVINRMFLGMVGVIVLVGVIRIVKRLTDR